MRVLLSQKSPYVPSKSGAGKANRIVLELLSRRGHECRVVAPTGIEDSVQERLRLLAVLRESGMSVDFRADRGAMVFVCSGIEVHAVNDSSRFDAYLADQIRQFHPSWTLVSEDRSFMSLAVALEADPACAIYLCHSQSTLPFGPEAFLQDPTKTELLRKARTIITPSGYVSAYLRRWAGLDSFQFTFPVFGAGPFSDHGKFDEGFVTIVNPSRIKGISIFIELASRFPDIPFAAVPTWATTEEDLQSLRELPNVRSLPFFENVDDLFALSRVLLVPSLWGEAFGNIVVDAMVRGIPVLASVVGGLPEAKLGVDYVLPVAPVESYSTTLDHRKLPIPVVPAQDVQPWIGALREVLGDRRAYQRVSHASRDAAVRFVAGLSVSPLEVFLRSNTPESNFIVSPQPPDAFSAIIQTLSPDRVDLLARMLKKTSEKPPA